MRVPLSVLLASATLALVAPRAAAAPDPVRVERIVDAIYRAEGGERARVPYGILSVKVRDAAHARQICRNTVVNNYRRWEQSGKPGDFLLFLAMRYCPPSVDPVGHRNWLRNVRHFAK